MSEVERLKSVAAAVGRIPSGLFVITARNGTAETGMLGSWVQQCSFEPLQVSVAIRRDRDVIAWLTPDAPFTINILDDTQTNMIVHFGRGFALGEPAFEGLEVKHPMASRRYWQTPWPTWSAGSPPAARLATTNCSSAGWSAAGC